MPCTKDYIIINIKGSVNEKIIESKGVQRVLEIRVVYTSSSSSSSSGASDSEVSDVDASDEPVVGSIPETIFQPYVRR